MAAGLLVLPLAGQEDRYVDPVDERDRIQRVGDLPVVVLVLVDLRDQVRGLVVQRLVGGADCVALLDLLLRVCLLYTSPSPRD